LNARWGSSAIALAFAGVGLALALAALSLPRQPYTGLALQGGRVAHAVPGGPGERAGLRVGDEIRPPGSAAGSSNPLAAARPGVPLSLERVRAGQSTPVWLAPEPLPGGEQRMMAALLAVASGFVLLAGLVWAERRDRLTRVFVLLCIAFALLLAPLPRLAGTAAWWYEVLYGAASLALPALFVHFFALFPDPDRVRGAARSAIRLGYALSALLLAAAVAAETQGAVPGEWRERLRALLPGVAAGWFTLGLGVALAVFAVSVLRAPSADARRRLRVALAGTLLGAGPLAALTLWRNLSPDTPIPFERAAVLLTLLVPGSFAWAIAVHHVFDFGVAVRAMALAAGLALAGGLAYLATEWLGLQAGPEAGMRAAAMVLATMGVGAAVAGPLSSLLRGRRAVLVPDPQELLPLDGARERSPAALLGRACDGLAAAMRLDGCAAVALGPGGPEVATSGRIGTPTLGPALAVLLAGERRSLDLEELDLPTGERAALQSAGVRWLVPVGHDPLRGVLLLGRRLAGPWLGRGEQRELERLAGHLDVALENLSLRREASSRSEMEREMRRASAWQAHLLPRRAPVYPTLECAAAALSSEPVGGDYYDFVEVSPREFTLAVGDAAGKGVPAALVLAGVQARFRIEARQGAGPGAMLAALNRELVGLDQPDRFMGLLCARVAVREGRLWFANAGLTPPLVRRHDGHVEEVPVGGLFLGVSGEATYPEATVRLDAGEVAVLHTDGLTEARRGDELFGVRRVQEVLEGCAGRRATDVLEALLGAVRAFADHPLDDLTVVVLRQLTRPARGRGGDESPQAGEGDGRNPR
jgi:serine phosphatase RsbU (regulator of sigma subunit)